MGIIQVAGPSGKSYSVRISGDVPSPTEQERIRQYVAQQETQFSQDYARMFGQEPVFDDGTALGRGYEVGKAGAYSRLGTATEYLGQGLGIESLAGVGQRMRQSGDYEAFLESLRQPAPTTREDVTGVGSALTFLGEGIGQSIPEMLAPLAASAVGTVAGTIGTGNPFTGGAIGLGAGAATAFPSFFGGNVQRQEQAIAAGERDEVDVQAAVVAAIGQSALNSIGDKLLLGGFLRPGQKWLTRTAVGAGEGAAVEVPTEIAQQILERRQAGLPLDSDEAISEYIDAGILGGVMGGGIRATTAGLGIGVERPQPITDPTRLISGPPSAAQTVAARIIPSSDVVTPGPATAGNTTTVETGGRTVTRVGLSDGAVLEFDGTPDQATIQSAVSRYNAGKAAPSEPQPAEDLGVGPDIADVEFDTGPATPAEAAPEVAPTPTPPTPKEPEAATVDYAAVLDELGVPRTAAVRKAVKSGAIKTDLEFQSRLARFAAATTSDRATRVNEYLQRATAPAEEVAPTPAAAAPQPPTADVALATIPFDQYERKPGSAELVPRTNVRGEAPIIDLGGRKMVMVDVNGVQVPFYLSSGLAGKKDVAAGKWYPILGIGPDGWINKGSQAEINNYYGSAELRAAAEKLDARIGDIRDDSSVPRVKPQGAHIDFINQGLSPVANGEADTRARLQANLETLLSRIAAGSGTRTTQETQDAEVTPSGPVEPDEQRGGDGVERGSEQPSAEPVAGEPEPTPAEAPEPGPVGGAALGAPEPSVAKGAQPDALTPKKTTTPEEYAAAVSKMYEESGRLPTATALLEDEEIAQRRAALAENPPVPQASLPISDPMSGVIPGAGTGAAGQVIPAPVQVPGAPQAPTPAPLFPTTKEEMARELDNIGVGERAKVRRLVDLGEIATPESFVAALGKTRIDKADVKARRDSRIAEMREALRTAAADPAVDRVVAQIDEVRQYSDATARLSAWFDANASEDLKAADDLDKGQREAETLPASAVRSILALVETTPDGDSVTPAVAAVRYFGRTRDPGYALHMIAHDAAQAKGKPRHRIPKTWDKASILGTGVDPETETDRATLALLDGQGYGTATKAVKWVKDNLPPDVYVRLMALQNGRATKDRAGYAWINYASRSDVRDKVRGKAAAGRVGPAQAVNEPTAAEVEERENQIRKDREALEDAARANRGFTPEQWQAMDTELRQSHVLDYLDLMEAERRPWSPELPEGIAPAEQATAPQRRALPRRRLSPRQEALEQLREEIEAVEADLSGPAELDFGSFAGVTEWPSDAHPRATALIRSGDFKGALRVIAATTAADDLRQLAGKLLSRIADTRVQVVAPEVMNSIRAEISPETPSLGVETPSGVYVHPRNEAQIAAMRREGHDAAADLIEQYGGQILFNETSPLSPELVLHEAVHRVADATLANPSHPLSRQLDKLRVTLLKFMPANEYGLSNVRELLTEGMTNPVFRRNLSRVNTEGKPYSARQEFKRIMRNFLRSIVGRPPVKPDTPLTALDRALDAVLAANPNEMQSGEILGASFAPGRTSTIVKNALQSARVPTKADLIVTRKMMQNTRIPVSWKGTLLRLAVPLDYVADMAAPNLPSARRVHTLMGQHQQAIREGVQTVVNTTEATAKVLAKYARDQQKIDDFNDTAYAASRLQVDPRKDESAYRGYSYQYNVLDKDGNIVRRVESQRYKTETERNKALQAYNAKLSPQQKTNRIARAKVAFSESAETSADHKRLRAKYLAMPKDLQVEFSRMLELQPAVGKGWIEAIRERIEAYVPNDKAVQNKIYNNIYNKILSGRLLDPYLAFARSGAFRLTYRGVDPLTLSVDPVTGAVDRSNAEVTEFKHSFDTESERQAAIDALMSLPAEDQISDINPYEDGTSGYSRQEIPLDFVSKVLSAIDDSGTLASIVDPQSGATKDLREQVINLVLDSVPESSFINSFKKRQGVRGFRGDVTPITETKSAGDVLKNMRESAMRIARKTADLKYGAQFATVRKELNEQNLAFQNNNPLGLSPQELSRQRAEVSQYASVLTDYTRSPFAMRNKMSRAAGATTYMLTLGFNVSTALVTLSQIPLFVYPVLAGKYSDVRAIGAIGAANRILAQSGRDRTFERIGPDGQIETGTEKVRLWEHSTEYNTAAYLAPLIEYARKNGVFNRSLMQDELLGEQPSLWEKISAATGILQHQSERYSRESALNAAYILELQDLTGNQSMSVGDFVAGLESGTVSFTPAQAQAAAESAVNVSEKSNGPIYAAAGPLASQGNFTSLVYMFKRHPIAMLNLLFQTASRGMGSTAPADRRIAQRQLARMFGSLSVFAGALGLPLMQQIGWIYDLFADDDEPDFESAVRMTLGEAGAFGLVDYMTGMRISERIGMGASIYRPGYASQDAAPLFQVMEGLGGPVLGMWLKYTSGRQLEDLRNGDYQRFVEGVAPTSIANFFKAVRFAAEGAATRRGDLIDDIGPFHIAAQAFGFMPASYERQLAMNSLGTRVNNAINREKSRIMQRIHRARAEGDTGQLRRLMEQVREFNARNPQNRIDEATLERSRVASQRVTDQTSNGLYVSPQNRARIQAYLDAYGPSSIFQ